MKRPLIALLLIAWLPLEGDHMVSRTIRIPYQYGQTVNIRPLYDVHRGHAFHNDKAFRKFLADADPETYFIGGGDTFDSIIPTDRRYQKSSDASPAACDDIIDWWVDDMCELLSPYADRIFGMLAGNHELSLAKHNGTNPLRRLCSRLNIPYLSSAALLRLQLHDNGSRVRTVVIRAHHGFGKGSRTQGADLTSYEKSMSRYEADIFLFGHTHSKKISKTSRFGFVGKSAQEKTQMLCTCGCFLNSVAFDTETTNYAEEKDMPPSNIGGIEIQIKPTRNSFELIGVI